MTSPFAQHLGTNYAPSDAEIVTINAWCLEPKKEIALLNAEIKILQDSLDLLLRKRAALQDDVNAHTQLLSPLRRLFPELLSQIFVLCLPTDRNPVMHASDSPMLLTRVCSRWRSVAMSTPVLWSALHIVVPLASEEILTGLRRTAMIEWLERSGSTPLSISLVSTSRPLVVSWQDWQPGNSNSNIPEPDSHVIREFTADLASFSRRLRSIRYKIPPPLMFPHPISPGDVPILDTLAFIPPYYCADPDFEDTAFEFVQSLHLRQLTLYNIYAFPSNFPTGQLTYLALQYTLPSSSNLQDGTSSLLVLLSQCPNLESCILRGDLWEGDSHLSSRQLPLVSLLKLVKLELQLARHDMASTENILNRVFILQHIYAPLLQSLEVAASLPMESLTSGSDRTFDTLKELVLRSGCSLRNLYWKEYSSNPWPRELVPCLNLCPNLETLCLDPVQPATATILHGERVLTEMMSGELCPKLERFTLLKAFWDYEPIIGQFARSRAKTSLSEGSGIRYLKIGSPPLLDPSRSLLPPMVVKDKLVPLPQELDHYEKEFGMLIELAIQHPPPAPISSPWEQG